MLVAEVFRNGIISPGAAAESKGRGKFEVIKVSDTALGRRSVDKYTASFHSRFKLGEFFFFSHGIKIN